MFRRWRCALSFRYVPKVDPTSRRQSWPPCDSITAWLCETSQSCSSEMRHLRPSSAEGGTRRMSGGAGGRGRTCVSDR